MAKKINKRFIYIILAILFFSNPDLYFKNLVQVENHVNQVRKEKLSNDGFISNDNYNLFWFIHISDTHFVWNDQNKIDYFYNLLNVTYKEIEPLFIYHTGDIVDANQGLEQNKLEWEIYRNALIENSMNTSIYMDVIGNHDAIQDPLFQYYLNHSMMGNSFNTTQFSFNKSLNFGEYAFIGLNTAKKSYNLFEFGFIGSLNSEEINWYENELEKYKNFDKIFVFGHHPPSHQPFYKVLSEESVNGKDFYELNKEYNVSYYFSGHIHENSIQYIDELLSISTINFVQNTGKYRIVVLDNNSLSTTIANVGAWPQAVITNPSKENCLFKNLNKKEEKIRVIAWDPKGIDSITWSFFDANGDHQITKWEPLERIFADEPLWEGDLGLDFHGKVLLKIRVEGLSGVRYHSLLYSFYEVITITSILTVIFMTLGLISLSLFIITNTFIQDYKKRK
jgi:Icc-related predicted phosphoesterase